MQSKVSGIIQIAAVYVGTVVGAGFATGREIVEFFTKYGFYGLLGICVAGLLFIYFGTKVMLVAVRINARSYQDFNAYLFGNRWALYINGLFFIMLFCVNAVMLSGAGSLFEEQLGMPKTVGISSEEFWISRVTPMWPQFMARVMVDRVSTKNRPKASVSR